MAKRYVYGLLFVNTSGTVGQWNDTFTTYIAVEIYFECNKAYVFTVSPAVKFRTFTLNLSLVMQTWRMVDGANSSLAVSMWIKRERRDRNVTDKKERGTNRLEGEKERPATHWIALERFEASLRTHSDVQHGSATLMHIGLTALSRDCYGEFAVAKCIRFELMLDSILPVGCLNDIGSSLNSYYLVVVECYLLLIYRYWFWYRMCVADAHISFVWRVLLMALGKLPVTYPALITLKFYNV